MKVGEILVVIEAMKMEHQVSSLTAGVVDEIAVAVGASVEAGDALLRIEVRADATTRSEASADPRSLTGGFPRGSNLDHVDPSVERRHQLGEVTGVGCSDYVIGVGQHRNCRIDRIHQCRPAEKSSRLTAEKIVEGTDLDAVQCPGEQSLPARPSPPDLGNDPAVGPRWRFGAVRRLEATPHRPVVALKRNQGARVENQRHRGVG